MVYEIINHTDFDTVFVETSDEALEIVEGLLQNGDEVWVNRYDEPNLSITITDPSDEEMLSLIKRRK